MLSPFGENQREKTIPELTVEVPPQHLTRPSVKRAQLWVNPLASFLPVLNDHVAAAIGLLEISRMAVVSATV